MCDRKADFEKKNKNSTSKYQNITEIVGKFRLKIVYIKRKMKQNFHLGK